jgi:glycerol transport system ATP-binding protein
VLLDEPLANLDYKLREELREELPHIFAKAGSIFVYATTEPTEALLLGGHTAVLDAGELLQYGPTAEVFHRPRSIRVARAFSDPPMNLVPAAATPSGLRLEGGLELPLALPDGGAGALTAGFRASALRVSRRDGDIAIDATVELAEISGSDTFVHVASPQGELVAQLAGVHDIALNAPLVLWLDPRGVHVFDAAGALLAAPQAAGSSSSSVPSTRPVLRGQRQ